MPTARPVSDGQAARLPRRRALAAGTAGLLLGTAGTTPAAPPPTVPARPVPPVVLKPVSLAVGPGERFQRIAQAFTSLSTAGGGPVDLTVTLDPAVEYVNDTSSHFYESKGHPIDWPPWEQYVGSKLLMRSKPGSNRLAVLRSGPESLYYGKGILNLVPSGTGWDQTLKGLHFIGPHRGDSDGRLACIWIEPNPFETTVTLEDCELERADDGIVNGGSNTRVVLRRVYVHDCGSGSGYTHNAYLGNIRSLLVEDFLSVRADTGHLLKSRATTTTIRRARLFDGETGSSSYALDCPNGGTLDVDGLVIHRGPHAKNAPCIRHGEEGSTNPDPSIRIRRLTLLAEKPVIRDFGSPIGLMNDGRAPIDCDGAAVWGITADRAYNDGKGPAPFPGGLRSLGAMPRLDLSSPVRPG